LHVFQDFAARNGRAVSRHPIQPQLVGFGKDTIMKHRFTFCSLTPNSVPRSLLIVGATVVVGLLLGGAVSAQPAASPWPMFGQDSKAHRQSPFLGPQGIPHVQWTFQARHAGIWPSEPLFYAGVAIGENSTIYAPSFDGYLYALDSSGQMKWEFNSGTAYYSAPALGPDGTVYVAAVNAIFAIDPSGHEIWRHQETSYNHSAVLVDGAGNVFATRNNKVPAFAPDGALRWQLTLDMPIYSSLTLDDHGVLYAGASGKLYAIVPEPSTLVLLGIGALGLLAWAWRRK
jgi:outer membrane protein assembly factor BamB